MYQEKRRHNLIFIIVVVIFLGLCGWGVFHTITQGWNATFGGSIASDCDKRDVYQFDDDCGYYNESGVFIFYSWVTPGVGGRAPSRQRPKPPQGVHTTKPQYQGQRSSNVQQLSPQKPAPRRAVTRGGK